VIGKNVKVLSEHKIVNVGQGISDSRSLLPSCFPVTLYVGGYFPFSYLENGSIKIARSLGVSAAGGETKMVTVIKNWKMVEYGATEPCN
jgi:hypothetical protein